ncbi:hypothetical protein ACOSP7_000706 [Xanthoceras sorbifolium]
MDDDEIGNRFYPSEEEIISHYLDGKMQGMHFPNVIHEIDICKFEPWDLPEQAAWQSNDPVWYFFSEPDYKYANSTRINRRTTAGYWKPTGRDRTIRDEHGREIGVKKNLVFYQGRFNKGVKTIWVMHEYHSHNARFYQKPFVLCRLKRKSDDNGSDTCDGPSYQMASQGNPQPPELESLPEGELGVNSLSETLSQMYPAAQGPSYSTGSNNEPNAWRSHIHSSYTTEHEQDEEFVNSLWADPPEGAYFFEETVNTRLHDFNPPKSLRRVYTGDSSYMDAQTAYSQWGHVLETPSLLSGNASSKEYRQIQMVRAPKSKKPRINCIQLLSEEFPFETRSCKPQRLPKSHNIEKKSAPEKLYLQDKVSSKAVSRDEVRDDAKLAIDLPQKENTIVKYVKDQRIARSSGKTSSKMRFDGSNGSRKGYIIFLETPPFGYKSNPPSVYVGNILLAVLLIIFIIREMKSLH